MLTLKQVAERSGIGPSLAAFYRDKYEEYLKTSGEGRHRKYDESNVELFKLIAQRYKEGRDYEQIKQELDSKYGVLVVKENNAITTQQDIVESIRTMFVEELGKRDSLILELKKELSSIKASIEARDRLSEERDFEIMELMRAKQKKPWWKWGKKDGL